MNVTSSSKWVGEPDQMETCALDRLPMELLLNILARPPKFNLYLVDHLCLESSLIVCTETCGLVLSLPFPWLASLTICTISWVSILSYQVGCPKHAGRNVKLNSKCGIPTGPVLLWLLTSSFITFFPRLPASEISVIERGRAKRRQIIAGCVITGQSKTARPLAVIISKCAMNVFSFKRICDISLYWLLRS